MTSPRLPAILALALLTFSAPAHAGWYARQIDQSPGQETKPDAAEIFYEGGKIRIDQGKNTSVIYDLGSGEMIMINHADKSYMKQTLEELAAMRDKMVKQLRSQLDQMPPNVRAQIEPKLEQMEKGSNEDVKPIATGKKDKVGKYSCDVHRWKSAQGEGEVCLAKDVGVNLDEFATYAKKLSDRMTKLKLGGGQGAGSLAMLEMARSGFPVRTKSTMQLGPGQTVESVSVVEEIKPMKVEKSKFELPAGYTKKDMPEGPGMGPPPGAKPMPAPVPKK